MILKLIGRKVIYKNKRYIVYEHGGYYKDDNDKFYLELDLFNEEENYIIKNVNSSFVIRINK